MFFGFDYFNINAINKAIILRYYLLDLFHLHCISFFHISFPNAHKQTQEITLENTKRQIDIKNIYRFILSN